jgi:RNA polymerase sigma factor (sigma-70 family)
MPDRRELELLLTQNLDRIRRMAASVCRRNGVVDQDEVEDFLGWVLERLVEDDYAILRKFRGEAHITTYLTVVVTTLFRDYRVKRWGRWRPSAGAKRLGEVAVRLETLVHRDGYRVDQAGELLRGAGVTDLSDGELLRMLHTLPPHAAPRPMQVGEEPLENLDAGGGADDALLADEAAGEHAAALTVLKQVRDGLSPEDRVIVKLWIEGMSVANIARSLNLLQKPLYRRLERIFKQLREQMEKAGITKAHVQRILRDAS